MSKRRTDSPEFKARVAMEAISGRKTIQEIASDHAIHPTPLPLCQQSLSCWHEAGHAQQLARAGGGRHHSLDLFHLLRREAEDLSLRLAPLIKLLVELCLKRQALPLDCSLGFGDHLYQPA